MRRTGQGPFDLPYMVAGTHSVLHQEGHIAQTTYYLRSFWDLEAADPF